MNYMALIYDVETEPENPEALFAAYGEFTQAAIAAGVFVSGEPLEPSSTATCVQLRGGKIGTTDGPFIETKEQMGGFYILNCDNLDQAVEWASKIPHAATGTVEVRPITVLPAG